MILCEAGAGANDSVVQQRHGLTMQRTVLVGSEGRTTVSTPFSCDMLKSAGMGAVVVPLGPLPWPAVVHRDGDAGGNGDGAFPYVT
jgi:hypothetical protein